MQLINNAIKFNKAGCPIKLELFYVSIDTEDLFSMKFTELKSDLISSLILTDKED
jgi:hypothetical protein